MTAVTMLLLAACALATAALLVLVFFGLPSSSPAQKGSVQIVVLGDIGRSPRMQYHALSIAQNGGQVQLVGFMESEPIPELRNHASVQIVALSRSPRILNISNKLAFILAAPLKVLFQIWTLWSALAYSTPACEWMLVQNPPSIPTLALALFVCRSRKVKLVIDWHNFGYSILALKLGHSHPLVQLAKVYEQGLGRFVHYHFAVTNAMCAVLESHFGIQGAILPLHDRPSPLFVPLTDAERIAFFTRHELTAAEVADIIASKTRVVVSSTSWTADEDFSVLLEALCNYSERATSDSPHLPELLVIITGKGPLKLHYLEKIKEHESKQELEMVTIKTAWLSFEDYASLLGAADLGVSLHTSSSGVDLPMKVVDMFGAGLPVLGYNNYQSWPELVREGINGMGFSNAKQMSDIMVELFNPTSQTLNMLKEGAIQESKRRWDSEWDPVAGRLFGLTA